MRSPVVWFRPRDLTVMPIRFEKRLQSFVRVVFEREGRRTALGPSRSITREEILL